MEMPTPRTYFQTMTAPRNQPTFIAAFAAALVLTLAAPAMAAGCGGSVQTGHGDSSLALAQRCGTTVQRLRLANPGIDMNQPLKGQIVTVPGNQPPSYIPDSVRRGAAPAPAPLTPFGQSPTYRRYQKSLSHRSSLRRNTYTIQRGDTLSAVAARANVPLGALLDANPGVNPRALAVGQRIVVPSMD